MEKTESFTKGNGIKVNVTKKDIFFSRLFSNGYQKPGTVTAELKQEILTRNEYPAQRVSTELQDNLFDVSAFGFESKIFDAVETRVAWLNVPEAATKEQIEDLLAKAVTTGATLYRVLSNAPILSEDQKSSIVRGQKTLDDFANSQVVRIPETEKTIELGTANTIALFNGKVQYRRVYFSKTPKEDVDLRDTVEAYVSPEIAAEIEGAGILETQTI